MKILLVILFSLEVFAYDRCDDLCRVLGFENGGACLENGHCYCQPNNVDVTEYLETVCDDV